jgi:hypothetical protein
MVVIFSSDLRRNLIGLARKCGGVWERVGGGRENEKWHQIAVTEN